ncbi:MAG: helix-turn-helix domain-containing protein [Erysipelotrichaceae bacterium]|nr:helix-turn-helix domain-containing protein [Erysipelotrichaceae bacterium]
MNQMKIGEFLKELRNEKGLTQEQLAEYFNVSNRSVSRWENGYNMPDLSMLVELSHFYNVDMSEIINGERKSKMMNDERTQLISDYAENEKEVLLKRMRIINIIGTCAMAIAFVMMLIKDNRTLPVFDYMMGLFYGIAFGALLTSFFYTTCILVNFRKYKSKKRYMNMIVGICIVICVLFLIASILASI